MKSILEKQAQLQTNFYDLKAQSVNPSDLPGSTKLSVVDYIKEMHFFMNEEVTELLEEVAGSRNSLKPWLKEHDSLKEDRYVPDGDSKSEAIDVLCFCMNILLAAGITHENIDAEYDKVYDKIKRRQDEEHAKTK